MGKVVLNDGRILDLTSEQSNRLAVVIMITRDMTKGVKVGDTSFRLNQIVTEPEEIAKIMQQKMFNVPTVPVKSKKRNKVDRLA